MLVLWMMSHDTMQLVLASKWDVPGRVRGIGRQLLVAVKYDCIDEAFERMID